MNNARIIGNTEIMTIIEFDNTSLIENIEYAPEILVIRKIPISKPTREVNNGNMALWYGLIVQIRCMIKNTEEIIIPPEKYVIAKVKSIIIIFTFYLNMS